MQSHMYTCTQIYMNIIGPLLEYMGLFTIALDLLSPCTSNRDHNCLATRGFLNGTRLQIVIILEGSRNHKCTNKVRVFLSECIECKVFRWWNASDIIHNCNNALCRLCSMLEKNEVRGKRSHDTEKKKYNASRSILKLSIWKNWFIITRLRMIQSMSNLSSLPLNLALGEDRARTRA